VTVSPNWARAWRRALRAFLPASRLLPLRELLDDRLYAALVSGRTE
jgi:hypothetical protein